MASRAEQPPFPGGLQQLLSAVEEVGGTWLVTADHGNAEDMVSGPLPAVTLQLDGRSACD